MKKLNLKSFLSFPNHRVLSCVSLGLTLGSCVFLVTHLHDNKRPNAIMSQLEMLQSKLSILQDSVSKPAPEVNLSSMTHQIQQLSQQLDDVRSQNASHLDQALNQTESVLSKRLNDIQQMIRHLEEKKTSLKYLPVQSLPFSVISLDSIQHVSVATIAYDFKHVPLEKGDSLAGWRVISIDYGTQHMEFENTKKERVLVTLNQIGSGEL